MSAEVIIVGKALFICEGKLLPCSKYNNFEETIIEIFLVYFLLKYFLESYRKINHLL